MINHFTFNGTSTAQLGLIVSGVSIFGAGSRKVEKAGIPGRNGDLQIELGGFNNYTVRYTVSITKNFTTTAQQIREWLLESKGYCDLTDTYHPDEIRKACFNSGIEFTTSMLYKYGQASIQFDCLPERYLTTNTPITTTATADTTTDTTLSLSTVPTPINISLNGNTTQEGSSGKNILDKTTAIGTAQVTVTQLSTGIRATSLVTTRINVYATIPLGTAPVGKTITVSATCTPSSTQTPRMYLFWGNASNQATTSIRTVTDSGYRTLTTTIPSTIPSGSTQVLLLLYARLSTDTATASGVYVDYTNLQVEIGSTATSYEPHISPTNPQIIHSVSGDNTINVTGENIFDNEEVTNKGIIDDNGTVQTQNIRLFSGKIAVIPDTTYTFKTSAYSQNNERIYINRLIFYGKDGSFLRRNATYNTLSEASFTIPSDVYFLVIDLRTQAFTTNLSKELLQNNTQLEKGSTATTYEPYTRQSYPLYLPAENLLNQIVNPLEGTYTQNYRDITSSQGNISAYDLEVGVTYTFSVDVECSVLPFRISIGCGTGAYQYDIISQQFTENGRCAITFTPTSTQLANNRTKFAVRIPYFTASTTFTVKVSNMQLEKGNHANHYTPYGTTPIELNKIGTYQDYIYKNGSKWYVHKEFNKIDMGTLTWAKTTSSTVTVGYYFSAQITDFATSSTGWLCENYPNPQTVGLSNVVARYGAGVNKIGFTASSTLFYVIDSTYADERAFKTAVNGVELVYRKRTATNTEITDTTLINQLNNIEKAYSYNGTTNILQVSNDNGFMLAVVSLHGSTFNSNYKGEPIITVNATGLIYLNGEVMEVLSAPVTINCQTMQCYNGVVNMNNEVRVNDFPEIKIGANVVGSSMALTITPNNWRH